MKKETLEGTRKVRVMFKSVTAIGIYFVFNNSLYGDPSPFRKYQQDNSKCSVESTAGEYPLFSIIKGEQIIFKPKSDGVSGVSFSNDGKYIALGSSEIDMIDVNGKYFHLVIVNCETEAVAGFNLDIKGLTAAWPTKWDKKGKWLDYAYYADKPGKQKGRLLFSKNRLPK